MHVCLTVNFCKIFLVSPIIALALTSVQFKFVVNQARGMIKEEKDMMIFSII